MSRLTEVWIPDAQYWQYRVSILRLGTLLIMYQYWYRTVLSVLVNPNCFFFASLSPSFPFSLRRKQLENSFRNLQAGVARRSAPLAAASQTFVMEPSTGGEGPHRRMITVVQ